MRWFLVAIIVAATSAGEVLQAAGMKRHGEVTDFRPGALRRLAHTVSRNRLIIASVSLMAFSFFAFMALLSTADLSFSVPATAASYVIETILAKMILKEAVGWRRWTGVLLVCAGVSLLSL